MHVGTIREQQKFLSFVSSRHLSSIFEISLGPHAISQLIRISGVRGVCEDDF